MLSIVLYALAALIVFTLMWAAHPLIALAWLTFIAGAIFWPSARRAFPRA